MLDIRHHNYDIAFVLSSPRYLIVLKSDEPGLELFGCWVEWSFQIILLQICLESVHHVPAIKFIRIRSHRKSCTL